MERPHGVQDVGDLAAAVEFPDERKLSEQPWCQYDSYVFRRRRGSHTLAGAAPRVWASWAHERYRARAEHAVSRRPDQSVRSRVHAQLPKWWNTLPARIELHNALNANPILQLNGQVGPAFDGIRGVLAPRMVKFAF